MLQCHLGASYQHWAGNMSLTEHPYSFWADDTNLFWTGCHDTARGLYRVFLHPSFFQCKLFVLCIIFIIDLMADSALPLLCALYRVDVCCINPQFSAIGWNVLAVNCHPSLDPNTPGAAVWLNHVIRVVIKCAIVMLLSIGTITGQFR